ncbi:hypothetical protein [Kribbella sp. NPDC051770]|uniref:hypothetical protein n=1 Tax=Kribbella sp. NPDC051770 TaxID=3155413 RepID=UPI00342E5E75
MHTPTFSSGGADRISTDDGKPVLLVRAAEIPTSQQVMVGLPHATADPASALSVLIGTRIDADAPYCVPAPTK